MYYRQVLAYGNVLLFGDKTLCRQENLWHSSLCVLKPDKCNFCFYFTPFSVLNLLAKQIRYKNLVLHRHLQRHGNLMLKD